MRIKSFNNKWEEYSKGKEDYILDKSAAQLGWNMALSELAQELNRMIENGHMKIEVIYVQNLIQEIIVDP